MIAFEVFVNGKSVCAAGASHVLSAGHDWTRHKPDQVHLTVGGIADGDRGPGHVEWIVPAVGVGDEVTIRIRELDVVDVPVNRPLP